MNVNNACALWLSAAFAMASACAGAADTLPSQDLALDGYTLRYQVEDLRSGGLVDMVETTDYVAGWRGAWEDGLVLRDKARDQQAVVPLAENGPPDLRLLGVDRARWCDADWVIVTLEHFPPRHSDIGKSLFLRVAVDPATLAPVAELLDPSVETLLSIRPPERLAVVCDGPVPVEITP